mgnify:CR=1 FL=1
MNVTAILVDKRTQIEQPLCYQLADLAWEVIVCCLEIYVGPGINRAGP